VIAPLESALDPWLEPSVARHDVHGLRGFQNLSQISERGGYDRAKR
jgi:hypothetical protein